ncbi:e3 ubiquitin-protein ligase el5 [Nicotiana attenuata]|uniref:E3 ubiquitin-protein ligase el5 n=1 Tax=Nicotiana attenuata TaxID=49451 RepID=A0A1J6HY18_NICAT|nr:e3 ubiquitin-protein ligase el5 [Nicotiana attenuata]
MAGLVQNITSSSETIAIAVIVAFPLMSILNAYAGGIKPVWSLVFAFCSSKYSKARKQEGKCEEYSVLCVICLSDISLGESRRFLPMCGHGFHTQCIEPWLKMNSICPLCRNPVPSTISVCCTSNRFVSSLISALDNFWTWFLDPLSSGVIASLSNEECDFL